MRINVYSQELTKEVVPLHLESTKGIRYAAVRFYLVSPTVLHHTPEDDDRSAITFWLPNNDTFTAWDLAHLFDKAAALCRTLAIP